MRLFGPPTGCDSAASESNHKTEVKAPAKRTQQIKSTLIKQTCKRVMESRTIDQLLDREFDLFHHKSFTGVSHPTEGGRDGLPYMKWDEKKNPTVPWFPSDVLKVCCNMVLPAAGTNMHCGSRGAQESDSGQLSNIWYSWANFQLDLLDRHGLQLYSCQILCLLHLEGPFPPGSSVSGFELVHNGYYAAACCFLSVDPILSKRAQGRRDHHALVKQGVLRNK
eukprot:jgi/Psemu1/18444/gm1.18444_g